VSDELSDKIISLYQHRLCCHIVLQ